MAGVAPYPTQAAGTARRSWSYRGPQHPTQVGLGRAGLLVELAALNSCGLHRGGVALTASFTQCCTWHGTHECLLEQRPHLAGNGTHYCRQNFIVKGITEALGDASLLNQSRHCQRDLLSCLFHQMYRVRA